MHHDRIEPRERASRARLEVADRLQHAAHLALGRLEFRGIRDGRGQLGSGARAAALKSQRSMASSSARSPPGRTATVSTTGTPRSRASAARSSWKPRCAARSLMFSATIIGRPQPLQLERQAQRQPQVGRIEHADDELRRRLAGRRPVTTSRVMASSSVVGHQAVGAGQIEHAIELRRCAADEGAFLALDGDARIVRDLLPAAGQAIEQRRLAAIRRTDQGEARWRRGQRPRPRARSWQSAWRCGVTSTQTLCASRRRSANVVCPMRTTNGSRPGRASARISTCSPVTNPNSSRRRSSAESGAEGWPPTPITRPLVPGESAARLTKPG